MQRSITFTTYSQTLEYRIRGSHQVYVAIYLGLFVRLFLSSLFSFISDFYCYDLIVIFVFEHVYNCIQLDKLRVHLVVNMALPFKLIVRTLGKS